MSSNRPRLLRPRPLCVFQDQKSSAAAFEAFVAFGPHSFEFQTFSFPLWVVFPFSGNNGFGVGPVFNFPRLKSKTCLSDKDLVYALLKRSVAVFSSAVKMHRVAVISDKLCSGTLKSENRLISLNRLKYLVPKLPNSMRGCSL